MFLRYVSCSGFEYTLFDCPNQGIETDSCGHDRDAGVVCLTSKIIDAGMQVRAFNYAWKLRPPHPNMYSELDLWIRPLS